MEYILQNKEQKPTLKDLAKRDNCKTGEVFISDNIMDYMFSFSDRFTSDQRIRVQHVLRYSPMLPTPRNNTRTVKTRSTEGLLDLPYRAIK
ncbi:hypothetical protein EVA_07897 [gut metagenome]|uniref:Uncharacterized protein n=1 Tax=gut metagenome TaxID=749906 RepID=J9GAY8_9ZZZZ